MYLYFDDVDFDFSSHTEMHTNIREARPETLLYEFLVEKCCISIAMHFLNHSKNFKILKNKFRKSLILILIRTLKKNRHKGYTDPAAG